jgi:transposase
MAHRRGEAREQTTLFPVMLDDLVGTHSLVRVIDAWVGQLPMNKLGFKKAQAQVRGAPPYDPADLLKLYIWGYSNGSRSSRVLERECQTNVECMWLLGRLAPDHKTIANFRTENSTALVATCAAFVEFASQHRLITSKTVAIDGSKVRAVASRKAVLHKDRLEKQAQRNAQDIARYLELLDEQDVNEHGSQVSRADLYTAMGDLKARGDEIEQRIKALTQMQRSSVTETEPEAQPMRGFHGAPGYNLQTAVEADSHLIVHHDVCTENNDVRQLQPMAEAAAAVIRKAAEVDGGASDGGKVIALADSGYDNCTQIAALGDQQIITFVAPNRGLNPKGLFEKSAFTFDAEGNRYICPAGKVLKCKRRSSETNPTAKYTAQARDCAGCALKPQCTTSDRRNVTRHVHEDAAQANAKRVEEHPEMMDLRRQVVEHPFGTLKYVILGNARLLLRGLQGAKGELSLGVLVYNLKRVFSMKGGAWMTQAARG